MSKAVSGKFVLRIPPELHKKLREESLAKGLSLNELCSRKIAPERSEIPVSGPLPRKLIQEVRRNWDGELLGLVLFGSVARGEETARSDVDLLVVLKSKITRSFYTRWDELFYEDHPEISPHFVRLPETVSSAGSLWLETAIDGIVVWERDWLISRFFASLRKAILAGEFLRKMAYGHPYWILGVNKEKESA